jgi:prepilin signal peptidase PulO-like enzyme (type II secretory pathway)
VIPELILIILTAIAAGSFGNNVISHYIAGRKFDIVRSRCRCGDRVLHLRENIPVLSYLLQRGKCKVCEAVLEPRYMIMEVSAVLIAISLYVRYGISFELLVYFGFLYFLLLICFIDYRKFIIPNLLVVIPAVIAFANHLVVSREIIYPNIRDAFIVGIIFGAVNAIYNRLRNTDAIGWGDIKLLMVLTLFYGIGFTVLSLWITSVAVTLMFGLRIIGDKWNGHIRQPAVNNGSLTMSMNTKVPLGAYLSFVIILLNVLNSIFHFGIPV